MPLPDSQGSLLPVLKMDYPPPFQGRFGNFRSEFQFDWYDNPLPAETAFTISICSKNIFFAFECRQTPYFDRSIKKGDYAPGLWQKDAAELFLKEDDSDRYQEFNLSPAGAWWSMLFSGYRREDPDNYRQPVGLQTFSEIGQDFWRAALLIPREQLSISISFNPDSRANVSCIIGGPERQFLSWAKIDSKKPDFHRTDCFQKISLPGALPSQAPQTGPP